MYKKANKVLPDDPWEQLRMGIDAVFRSWNIPRAVKYREINKITGLRGTAVNVQTMVYGNINDNSGTGGGRKSCCCCRRCRHLLCCRDH